MSDADDQMGGNGGETGKKPGEQAEQPHDRSAERRAR